MVMRIGTERVGYRGLALIAAAGVAGLILAGHGWSHRGSGLAPGGLGAGQAGGATPGPAGGPGGAGPSPSPAASPAPRGQAAQGGGPLLSRQPYASAAFLIWPGHPAASARLALTGLRVSVRRHGTGISVAAGLTGQPLAAARVYPAGARVYVVEASLGDDSGGTDYNLGDDGLVVTDSRGRITQ